MQSSPNACAASFSFRVLSTVYAMPPLFFCLRAGLCGFVGVTLLVLALGCAGGPSGTRSKPSTELLDSLRSEVVTLQDRNRMLSDSLQFYDDVDSGQYYRELRALQDQMARMSYELSTLRDGGQTLTVTQVTSLFEPASAVLTDAGVDRLKPLAAQLRQTYPERQVRVEGHSDDTPLGERLQETYPSNWELSAARASAVVRVLLDLSGLDARQFAAVGYGASRPVASNETEAGRRANRRIRVAVLPTPRNYSRPFETSW